MKTLKLLNRKYLLIIFINFFLCFGINAEDEPIDIWNVDIEEKEQELSNDSVTVNDDDQISETSIYDLQSSNQIDTVCLLYTSPSPRDLSTSRMPSSA